MNALWDHLFRQNPLVTVGCALAVAGSLIVIGALLLLGQGAQAAGDDARQALGAHLLLSESASRQDADALALELGAWAQVRQATVISPQEHLGSLRRAGLKVDHLEPSLLPFSVQVWPKPGPEDYPALLERLRALEGQGKVASLEASDPQVARIASSLAPLRTWSWVAAALVGLVGVLVVTNAVGLAIFRRREEVEVLRLLGASDRHIGWPFLREGLVLGLLGGALACLVLLLGLATARGALEAALGGFSLEPGATALWLLPALLLAGVLLAWLGTLLSLRHHLRRAEAPWNDPGRAISL